MSTRKERKITYAPAILELIDLLVLLDKNRTWEVARYTQKHNGRLPRHSSCLAMTLLFYFQWLYSH